MFSGKLFSYQNLAWLILLLSLLVPKLVYAQYSEYEVKAVYLEKFTRFIDWPAGSAVYDTGKAFIISVIGENPFDGILEEAYSTQNIMDKSVEIRFITKIEQIKDTEILFISKSEGKRLSKIISFTKDKPILTVSDTKNYADKGVLINFFLRPDKIRFEINEPATRESGLTVSSLLFDVAKVIRTKEGRQ